MSEMLAYVIAGLVAGSLYGLAATGLVLTFKTSDVFNFAHGAIGAGAAYLFYDLRDIQGMSAPLAAVVTLGLVAPLTGVLLSGLAGRLAKVSTGKRVVATAGVLLVIQGILQLRYGIAAQTLRSPLPSGSFSVGDVNIGYDQLITFALACVGVVLLELLFRRSYAGLQMRGVVDNDHLLTLAGQSPAIVRAKAWAVGSFFAALSGVLLASLLGLDSLLLTFVVIQAFGAAAVGRFASVTLTFIAGLGIGVLQALLVAPQVRDKLPLIRDLPGFDSAVPFLVLFGVLLILPKGSLRERPVRRPPVAQAVPRRVRVVVALVAIGVALAAPIAYPAKLPVFTMGLVFVAIFASLFLLTEVANLVSLCQATFVAIGATTFCHLTTGAGIPWLPAFLLAGLAVVPVGAFVAVPAIRLSGVYLALATLGFGVLVEKLVYPRAVMFGLGGSRVGPRPDLMGLDSDRGYYYLCLVLAAAAIVVVAAARRGRLGRLLEGAAESPLAVATLGSSTNLTRVLVFSIAAFMAACGGALYVGVVGSVSGIGVSPTALVAFNSLMWVAVLAFTGRSTTRAPVIAALALVVAPSYLTSGDAVPYLTIAFGVLAVASSAFGDAFVQHTIDSSLESQDRIDRSPVRARLQIAAGARG